MIAPRLLPDDVLEQSGVVANCAMNRERQLAGVNSYTRELGFNPVDVLSARSGSGPVRWLDLCCGSGRALIQAAAELRGRGRGDRDEIVGVDLVDAFDTSPLTRTGQANLELIVASITTYVPNHRFDLITCLHGLHYVGDKLGVLSRSAGWLTDAGQLVVDLDLSSIRLADGQPVGARLTRALRTAGFTYDARRHRITRSGAGDITLPYTYLGADDRAGPNYTGQPAVNSFYRPR